MLLIYKLLMTDIDIDNTRSFNLKDTLNNQRTMPRKLLTFLLLIALTAFTGTLLAQDEMRNSRTHRNLR